MIRLLFGFFMSLLLAGPALANTWTDCVGNSFVGAIAAGVTACLDCTDAAGADDCVDSRKFDVTADSALICFNPDTATEGADNASIRIRHCSTGLKPAASPEDSCHSITTNVITGITGSPAVQDACHRVPPGAYFIDFVSDGTAGDEPQITFRGENN
jgi:hypothetical protein